MNVDSPEPEEPTMANHITQSQIQTLLGLTPVSALSYGQLMQLVDATERLNVTRVKDGDVGLTADPLLSAIFVTTNPNPQTA